MQSRASKFSFLSTNSISYESWYLQLKFETLLKLLRSKFWPLKQGFQQDCPVPGSPRKVPGRDKRSQVLGLKSVIHRVRPDYDGNIDTTEYRNNFDQHICRVQGHGSPKKKIGFSDFGSHAIFVSYIFAHTSYKLVHPNIHSLGG